MSVNDMQMDGVEFSNLNSRPGPPFRRGASAGHIHQARRASAPYQARRREVDDGRSNVDKWSHDLFETGSSLYAPKPMKVPTVSPSARPFGMQSQPASSASVPAIQAVASVPAPPTPRAPKSAPAPTTLLDRIKGAGKNSPSIPTTNTNTKKTDTLVADSGTSLAARLGLASSAPASSRPAKSGNSVFSTRQPSQPSKSASVKPPPRLAVTQAPPASRQQPERRPQQQNKERERRRREIERRVEDKIKAEGPTLVSVKNLVEGTTAEDVKTAFQDFGQILDCDVKKQPQGRDLEAMIVFRHIRDADSAVARLDGALADGRTLRVSILILPRTSKHHPLNEAHPDYPFANEADEVIEVEDTPEDAPSSLYSSEVAKYDPHATILANPVHQKKLNNHRPPYQPTYKAPPLPAPLTLAQRIG